MVKLEHKHTCIVCKTKHREIGLTMTEIISPELLWDLKKTHTLIDVRSPSEFSQGHIPDAFNLPLFNDEERAKVGTLYKTVSPDSAFLKGLDFVGPKMSGFIKKVRKWSPENKVLIHCWRGGKRSGSVAWLLNFAGFEVKILQGGYKNYRHQVLSGFSSPKKILILGGKTGTGKTAVLHALKGQGEQIIDLEGLAHHKGSAFGWIGEKEQPTTEQFENNLYEEWRLLNPEKRIWVENESRNVGAVFIPTDFWFAMKNAPSIHLIVPNEERLKHLVAVYCSTQKEDLIESFRKIEKKIGTERLKKCENFVVEGNFASAASEALAYYDKTYSFGFDGVAPELRHELVVDTITPEENAEFLIGFADKNLGGY